MKEENGAGGHLAVDSFEEGFDEGGDFRLRKEVLDQEVAMTLKICESVSVRRHDWTNLVEFCEGSTRKSGGGLRSKAFHEWIALTM